MKEARAAKAGASSTLAADPVPPPILSPPPPITVEAISSSPPSSPRSLAALQTPRSPLPIAAVPLAAASSPAPTPLDNGKRVLEVLTDDEDSEGVAPFRRRKSARVPLSVEASPQGGNPFMDNPPSATSLPPMTLHEERGEGAESASPPPPAETIASPASVAAAPDFIAIPPPIMHLMRGFSGGSLPEDTDRKEGMPFYLGAFLVVALEWRAQVTGLQELLKADAEIQKDLKDRCREQAEKTERMEGEMAMQAKAMNLLRADYDKLQVEVSRLRVEKEALEKQVASGDAAVEELEREKKSLIQEMAGKNISQSLVRNFESRASN
ncbi:proline-rich receptor-like protein kinase PERK13 [Phaseolus vulgaris]|uniref:proline-rich receptor-like protein kinase PERK13 n=1 Tax=Phaseolus vulgaris TaxID=3885 RepID=UPI0035CAF96D